MRQRLLRVWRRWATALGWWESGTWWDPLSRNALLNLNTAPHTVSSRYMCMVLSYTKVLISFSGYRSVRLNDWMVNLCTCTCGKIIALECLKLYDSCSPFSLQGVGENGMFLPHNQGFDYYMVWQVYNMQDKRYVSTLYISNADTIYDQNCTVMLVILS